MPGNGNITLPVFRGRSTGFFMAIHLRSEKYIRLLPAKNVYKYFEISLIVYTFDKILKTQYV